MNEELDRMTKQASFEIDDQAHRQSKSLHSRQEYTIWLICGGQGRVSSCEG